MCIYGKYMQIIIKEKDVHLRERGKEKRSKREERGDYLVILQLK